jgi:amino acid transporter
MKDMLIFNLYGVNWGISLAATTLTGAYAFPGADMSGAVAFALPFLICDALVVSFMAMALPRSGGLYVWNTYVLDHILGFMTSFGAFMQVTFAIGLYAALTVNYGASATFASLGAILNNPSLIAMGTAAATPTYTFVFGTLVIWISVPFFLVSSRTVKWFMWGIFIPCFIGVALCLGLLLTSSHAGFVSSFNAAMQPYTNSTDSYNMILNSAKQANPSYSPPVSIMATVGALPLGFWALFGYNQSVNLSGETKRPTRSQPLAVLVALFSTCLVEVLAFSRFYDVVGWDFNNAVSTLSGTPQYNLPAPPTFNFFVGLLTTNPVINVLIGLSFILWIFTLVGPLFLITSRWMFGWSFNRVAPAAFARVNNNGAPWVAVLISAAVAEVFLTLYAFTSVLGILNYTILAAIYAFIGGFTAVLFAYRKKTAFESSPSIVKRRIGAIPLLSILGLVVIIFYGFVIYFGILTPAFSGPTGTSSYELIAAVYGGGVVIYLISKFIRRRQGIDLGFISREIPPE